MFSICFAHRVRFVYVYVPFRVLQEDGYTPLIAAASNGQSKVVALLAEKGANIQAQDNVRGKHIIMHTFYFIYKICSCVYVYVCFVLDTLPPNNMSSTIYMRVCMYVCICMYVCMYVCMYLNVLRLPAYSDLLDDQGLCFY